MLLYWIVIENPHPELHFTYTEDEAIEFAIKHGDRCLSILAPDGQEYRMN